MSVENPSKYSPFIKIAVVSRTRKGDLFKFNPTHIPELDNAAFSKIRLTNHKPTRRNE
jgi:hypothetical protein